MRSMKIILAIFSLALQCISANNISIDAAFYDLFQNKAYFFQGDKYFACSHRDGLNVFEEEDAVIRKLPFLPTAFDAAYKLIGKNKSAAFIKNGQRYRTISFNFYSQREYPSSEEGRFVPVKPNAIAKNTELSFHFYIDELWITSGNSKEYYGKSVDKLPECPSNIEAALIIGRQLFAIKDGTVWGWDVHLGLADVYNVSAGFPKSFNQVFAGGDLVLPYTATQSSFHSKQFIGYTIQEVDVSTLQKCVEICLDLPYFSCSSFNYEIQPKTGNGHSCQINRFNANHFPANLIQNPAFVYYEAYR
ncbi:uncharacterized protein LOC135684625 [Rhopilema esculentum]|uniref:uncharacterized protein LOC135684625 n=1 Tax=Rhopilema esculentum TaxID=499914 RepID=UPI0031D85ED1